MLVESFDLFAWGGIVKKPICRWRDGSDGLDVEQPTEVSYDDSFALQSLVDTISQRMNFSRGNMTLK